MSGTTAIDDLTVRRKAQERLDEIDGELTELYRQVREKEAEQAKYDRIANPGDYERA